MGNFRTNYRNNGVNKFWNLSLSDLKYSDHNYYFKYTICLVLENLGYILQYYNIKNYSSFGIFKTSLNLVKIFFSKFVNNGVTCVNYKTDHNLLHEIYKYFLRT